MFKQLFIFASLTASAFGQNSPPVQSPPFSDDDETDFRNWMDRYNKKYDSESEFSHRLEIWKDNNGFIQEHNKKDGMTYTLGHNPYSDMTLDEFQAHFHLGDYSNIDPETLFVTDEKKANDVSNHRRSMMDLSETSVADEVNWTTNGAVSRVKDQGSCGSCWAFSAVAALESAHYLNSGQLTDLSEQLLVDCDPESGGCRGGYIDTAYSWVESNGGICAERDYPYTGRNGRCEVSSCSVVGGTAIQNYVRVTPGDVDELMRAIAVQPVTAGAKSGSRAFQFYRSGVLDADNCSRFGGIDHLMLFTGYGTDSGQDYWLIKNSWGNDWGEDGYVRIARREVGWYGVCAILQWSYFPVLA